jgi:hypothetical protein
VFPMKYQHNNLIFSPKSVRLILVPVEIFLAMDISGMMHILSPILAN